MSVRKKDAVVHERARVALRIMFQNPYYLMTLAEVAEVDDYQDVARNLVDVSMACGDPLRLLSSVIMGEFQANGHHPTSLLRNNCVATKIMNMMAHLPSSEDYVKSVVLDTVQEAMNYPDLSLEVDPRKLKESPYNLSGDALEKAQVENMNRLKKLTTKLLDRVTSPAMLDSMPRLIRAICGLISEYSAIFSIAAVQQLVGGFLILRYINVALVSPEGFKVIEQGILTDPLVRRHLTLVGKLVQAVSNKVLFGGKEEYLMPVNEYLESQFDRMSEWIHAVGIDPFTIYNGHLPWSDLTSITEDELDLSRADPKNIIAYDRIVMKYHTAVKDELHARLARTGDDALHPTQRPYVKQLVEDLRHVPLDKANRKALRHRDTLVLSQAETLFTKFKKANEFKLDFLVPPERIGILRKTEDQRLLVKIHSHNYLFVLTDQFLHYYPDISKDQQHKSIPLDDLSFVPESSDPSDDRPESLYFRITNSFKTFKCHAASVDDLIGWQTAFQQRLAQRSLAGLLPFPQWAWTLNSAHEKEVARIREALMAKVPKPRPQMRAPDDHTVPFQCVYLGHEPLRKENDEVQFTLQVYAFGRSWTIARPWAEFEQLAKDITQRYKSKPLVFPRWPPKPLKFPKEKPEFVRNRSMPQMVLRAMPRQRTTVGSSTGRAGGNALMSMAGRAAVSGAGSSNSTGGSTGSRRRATGGAGGSTGSRRKKSGGSTGSRRGRWGTRGKKAGDKAAAHATGDGEGSGGSARKAKAAGLLGPFFLPPSKETIYQAQFLRSYMHELLMNPDVHQSEEMLRFFEVDSIHRAVSEGNLDFVLYLYWKGADMNKGNAEGRTPLHLAAYKRAADDAAMLPVLRFCLARSKSNSPSDHGGNTPLHMAARSGLETRVQMLLDLGVRPNVANASAITPLHIAAEVGNLAMAKALVKKGASTTALDSKRRTPLHRAVAEERLDVVAFLLTKKADINAFDADTATPLLTACRIDSTAIVLLLLKQRGIRTNVKDDQGRTPLHYAVSAGNKAVIAQLLSKPDCDLHVWSTSGSQLAETPLLIAANAGAAEIATMLIHKDGTSAKQRNPVGWTVLHFASRSGAVALVELLLSIGVDVDAQDDKTARSPIFVAIEHKRAHIVSLLLKAGAKIDIRDKFRHAPLHYATIVGDLAAVELLLDAGAEINTTDGAGLTALHHACSCRHARVVDLLVRRGANVNLLDGIRKEAPLHIAANQGDLVMCRTLVDKGNAPVHAQSAAGLQPLHCAARADALDVCEFLVSKGAEIDDPDEDGRTALHYAVLGGAANVELFLINEGADQSLRDKDKYTAADYHKADKNTVAGAVSRMRERLASSKIRHGFEMNAGRGSDSPTKRSLGRRGK